MAEMGSKHSTVLVEPAESLAPWTIDDLSPELRDAAVAMGWSDLMPVQASAAPYLSVGRDMIVQSRTGSGKTGAFLIPLLTRVDPSRNHAQALILVPTRELARQVYGEFINLSKNLTLTGALVYGGVGYGEQLDALRKGAQVIIGTPGRVLDHLGRRSMNVDNVSTLIFDEADEMLSMGFYPDMKQLRRYLKNERTTWMFSATMPYKVQMLAEEFMREPEFLSLSAGHETVDTMEHRWYEAPTMEKDQILMRLFEMERPDSAIIFCNMKTDVEYVATVLKSRGYNAEMISGDLKQSQREAVMEGIKRDEIRYLIATDVAARGIDISDLSHVFLYDMPKDPEMYVHRSGRTARAGNTGVAITLIGDMSEKSTMKKIARKYGIEFVEMPTPTEEQLVERIGERLTILLEDRMRELPPSVKKRLARFDSVVSALAENDDERLLLAMLLHDLYQTTYNAPRRSQIMDEMEVKVAEERAEEKAQESRDGAKGGEPKKKRRRR